MEHQQRLREIIGEIVGADPGVIDDDFGPAKAPTWDSVNTLRIVTAIEGEFDISFAMADLANMTDFRSIRDLVAQKLS